MTPAFELVADLRVRGIQLWLDAGQLRYRAPAGALDAARLQDIRALKDEIIAVLAQHGDHAPSRSASPVTIPRREPSDSLPLSFAQERLWFLEQLGLAGTTYQICGAARLQGTLDGVALERSFGELVRRHESLRTRFGAVGDRAVQIIEKAGDWVLPVIDLSQREAADRELELNQLLSGELRRRFDLVNGPVFRALLLKLSEVEHVVGVTMHHIVADGWSISVLMRELGVLYAAYSQGKSAALADLPIQYGDYALWQRQWLQGQVLEEQLRYWREELAGAPPALELPTDRARPAVSQAEGASLTFEIGAGLSAGLRQLARREGATLYMVLLAGFQVLLSRWSGQNDVVVGTPVAGRNRRETEGLIGLFVNTLAIRARLSGNPSFRELLRQVRETALEAYAHQEVPFERLVEELQPQRSLARHPLFQVMFALENLPNGDADLAGLAWSQMLLEAVSVQFDFSLAVQEHPLGLRGCIEYAVSLFDRPTMQRLAEQYQQLLQAVSEDADTAVMQLPLLSEAQRHRMLVQWNQSAHAAPYERCVHELIAEQAVRTPTAPAVAFAGAQLSYAQLESRANALASELRGLGVGPEVRVALYLQRSPELVIGLLAILKAGGAFVPIDPEIPVQRLARMLSNAGVGAVLTQESLRQTLPAEVGNPAAHIVCLDTRAHAASRSGPRSRVGQKLPTPDCAAYVIYTSGSTGEPKGVLVPHRGLCNHVVWVAATMQLTSADRVLQKTSVSFDAAIWEFLSTLYAGACVVLAEPGGHRDAGYLARLIRDERISAFFSVPSALQVLLEEPLVPECRSVRSVMCGGERLEWQLAREFNRRLPQATLGNFYGPTEASDDSAHFEITQQQLRATALQGGSVPIGRPIWNAQLYVLDEWLQVVPIGVAGELYVGGIGLARGYLGRPGLTAERFVANPFGVVGSCLYRTGDRARYLYDGSIEFLSRLDHQVKIRGFRIELAEIETTLQSHAAVKHAAVVMQENAGRDKRLVAYVTAAAAEGLVLSDLQEHLAARLPEYMLPESWVILESMPLTTSGKVDRSKLATAQSSSGTGDGGAAYVAARTPTEEMLVLIWAELLDVERVGIEDNFFELGGHSLLAARLMARVRTVFSVELPLRVLFEAPTVAELGARLLEVRQSEAGARTAVPQLGGIPRPASLPLSFAQERLWFLEQLGLAETTYHICGAARLQGTLDGVALERSFGELVRRHESLRTRFGSVEGRAVQMIEAAGVWTLPVIDLSQREAGDLELEVKQLLSGELQRRFDLASGPVFRALLLKLSEVEHVVGVTMHHIVSDGWSISVLMRELGVLYAAYSQGKSAALADLPIQYGDYALWQRQWLQGEVLEEQLRYWREELAGAPPALELPTDRARPAVSQAEGASLTFEIGAGLSAGLRQLAQREGATLYMVLLAGFQVLLSRWSGQNDVVVGTPVAGRTRRETEELIGLFVNTLAIRARLSGNPSFRELLGQVRETALEAYAHQEVPFERLVEELQPERSLARHPLFQVMFALENFPEGDFELAGLTWSQLLLEDVSVQFDLSLAVQEHPLGLRGCIEYAVSLFDRPTMQRLAEQYQQLLQAVSEDADTAVMQLPLLSEAQRHRMLVQWNQSAHAAPYERCVHELIAEQAVRTPTAPAVAFAGAQLSYAQLESRANALASELRGLGVGPEVRVALYLQRSPELVIGLLAILKAGGAFVPIDPEIPVQRLARMLSNAGVGAVLTQESLRQTLPAEVGNPAAHIVCLDTRAHAASRSGPRSRVGQKLPTPDCAAYVIYTSGSTGEPKGVLVPHRGLCNHVVWVAATMQLTSADRVLQKTSVSFDAAIWEFLSTLYAGACVVLAEPGGHRDAGYLARLIRDERISAFFSVPSALQVLLEEPLVPECRSVRSVMCGGERLEWQLAREFNRRLPQATLGNFYGPTEASDDSAHFEITQQQLRATALQGGSVPIGRPIWNAQLYVLDEWLQVLPIGVAGELYVGGIGLARGYLGRPGLTAERFVANPFGVVGSCLYRTGDRARYLYDGSIEFLSRLDHQVKIRGFRIELAEIETTLQSHAAVKHAAVVMQENAGRDKRLVAYVTAAAAEGLVLSDLQEHLAARLPEYMLPESWVILESMPLTTSGKVDRSKLATAQSSSGTGDGGAAYVAARTPTEEMLVLIWAELLDVERVGIEDNFFELGGHSLLAARLMARVRTVFSVELPLRVLFEAPTVAELGARLLEVRQSEAGARTVVPQLGGIPRPASLPLSFAQERLWFLEQLGLAETTYHICGAARLQGTLDGVALERSFGELVRRHESLRTRFGSVEGRAVQMIEAAGVWTLPVIDLSQREAGDLELEVKQLLSGELQRRFDLASGPVFRALLLKLSEAEHVVGVTMHHIVSDGWSISVLMRELGVLYAAYSQGKSAALADLPIQYGDYALWQRQWLQGEVLEEQLRYWREELAGAPPALELPTDRARPAVSQAEGASLTFEIGAGLSAALRQLAQREGATLYMVLLAGFQVLLSRWSGQNDVVVGTPVAGRTRRETEELIGFFVNTVAIRARLSGNPSFRELLGQVRETALEAYAHQEVPFERLVEELQPQRSLARHPLFQVMFGLENFPEGDMELAGLTWSQLLLEDVSVQFDFSLTLQEHPLGLKGCIDYAVSLFDRPTMQRLAEQYQQLLQAVSEDADTAVMQLPLLSEAQRHRLLVQSNQSAHAAPHERGIHECRIDELIGAQAARTPAALAVVCAGTQLSYAQLVSRANAVASELRGLGVGPEVRVALYLQRSPELVIGLLAILKTGGAFVLIDPEIPAQHEADVLGAADCKLLLTVSSLLESAQGKTRHVGIEVAGIEIVGVGLQTRAPRAPATKRQPVPADCAACVIRGSDESSTHAGIVVTHRGLRDRTRWLAGTLQLTSDDVVLIGDFGWSALAVWEVLAPLCAGAQVVLAPDAESRDGTALAEDLRAHGVSVLCTVPGELRSLLRDSAGPGPQLRRVLCCADTVDRQLARDWADKLPHVALGALFIPCEAGGGTAYLEAQALSPGIGTMPIGGPLPDTPIYVLDARLQPQLMGAVGELYIGGDFLARGYWRHAALSSTRFVANPFGAPGSRMYRTGQRGRYVGEGGTLELLGPAQDRAMIRGCAVELSTVKAALLQQPGVEQACVVVRKDADGQSHLVGYVATDEFDGLSAARVRTHIKTQLANYMVPAVLLVLPKLPLGRRGTVDTAALPKPETHGSASRHAAPQTPAEQTLALIWSEMLQIETVGSGDNFFELGGYSLLAMRVIARMSSAFGTNLPLRTFFERPTIAEIGAFLMTARKGSPNGGAQPPLEARPRPLHVPLSFSQEYLWVLHRSDLLKDAYHIPAAVRLQGKLDVVALERSFGELVRRHESLRTRFGSVEGQAVQIIEAAGVWTLPVMDLSQPEGRDVELEVEQLLSGELQRRFDLTSGPVFRALLLKLGAQEHVLGVTMHHIVSDGWSISVLLRELGVLYAAYSQGKRASLADLPIQYGDYALWQRQWLQGEVLEQQLSYWREELAGAPPALQLPTDRPRPVVSQAEGSSLAFEVGVGLSAGLRQLARREGATLYMVLLAGFQVLLSRWSGQNDVVVGTPVAGRNRRETEELIGFFVNTVAMRARLSGNPSFRALLRQVRETALNAYAHQEVPFERLVEELQPQHNLTRHPLFQVLFALQDFPEGLLELPGLTLTAIPVGDSTSKLDLSLFMQEGPTGLSGVLEYSTELFERATMLRVAAQLIGVLEEFVQDPSRAVGVAPAAGDVAMPVPDVVRNATLA